MNPSGCGVPLPLLERHFPRQLSRLPRDPLRLHLQFPITDSSSSIVVQDFSPSSLQRQTGLKSSTTGSKRHLPRQFPRLKVLVERTQFHQPARDVEGNAGPALFRDERLRIPGDEFRQPDVSLFPRRGLR